MSRRAGMQTQGVRLVRLQQLLVSAHPNSIRTEDLAERFGVSPKTMSRDLDVLHSMHEAESPRSGEWQWAAGARVKDGIARLLRRPLSLAERAALQALLFGFRPKPRLLIGLAAG